MNLGRVERPRRGLVFVGVFGGGFVGVSAGVSAGVSGGVGTTGARRGWRGGVYRGQQEWVQDCGLEVSEVEGTEKAGRDGALGNALSLPAPPARAELLLSPCDLTRCLASRVSSIAGLSRNVARETGGRSGACWVKSPGGCATVELDSEECTPPAVLPQGCSLPCPGSEDTLSAETGHMMRLSLWAVVYPAARFAAVISA